MNPLIIKEKKRVVKYLCDAGAIYLRGVDDEDNDLDLFVNQQFLCSLQQMLLNDGYKLLKNLKSKKYTYYKLIAFDVIRIDIEVDLNYIFNHLFPKLSFKKHFINRYLASPSTNLATFCIIRNIFLFRKKYKYLEQFERYHSQLPETDIFIDSLKETPFRKKLDKKALKKFQKKNWWIITTTLKLRYFLGLLKAHIVTYKSLLYTGQIVAFIGPDGSGKSTIISILRSLLYSQRLYMGTNELLFTHLYKKLRGNNFLLVCKFLLIYLENIFRYSKGFYGKVLGRIVLMDRYPKYQYLNQKNIYGKFLNHIFYNLLYPHPDKIVVLENKPQTIINRKNELNYEEIQSIIDSHRSILAGKNNVLFLTNDELRKSIDNIIVFLKK